MEEHVRRRPEKAAQPEYPLSPSPQKKRNKKTAPPNRKVGTLWEFFPPRKQGGDPSRIPAEVDCRSWPQLSEAERSAEPCGGVGGEFLVCFVGEWEWELW